MSEMIEPGAHCQVCGKPATHHVTSVAAGTPGRMASGSFCEACAPRAQELLKPDEATYQAHEEQMKKSPWKELHEQFTERMKRTTQPYLEIFARASQRAMAMRRAVLVDDLLAGMLAQPGCTAVLALQRIGINVADLTSALGSLEVSAGPQIGAGAVTRDSESEARALGDGHIGSEHLLLAILHQDVGALKEAVDQAGQVDGDLIRAIKAIKNRASLG